MCANSVLSINPGGVNFGLLRVGGPGMANLLWLWSKSIIANHLSGIPILWPQWRQIKPAALLRREFSMGYYNNPFSRPAGYLSKWRADLRSLENVAGDEVLMEKLRDSFAPTGKHYYFHALSDPFELYHEYSPVVSQAFAEMNPAYSINSKREEIAVHIRRGDFNILDFSLPLSLYESAIDMLLSKLERKIPVVIYSDALSSDQEFWDWVPDGFIINRGQKPLDDLFALCRSRYLVGTARSSFSRAAAFLGQPQMFWCGNESEVSLVENLGNVVATKTSL